MNEQELREPIAAVKAGRVSRRNFTRAMVGLGFTGPFRPSSWLMPALRNHRPRSSTIRREQAAAETKDIVLGPTLLNPHFAVGAKDAEGAGIFYEPLASWDPNGNLVPVLAAEIPDIENGGVAADGMSVTWKLKTGVQWHDGQPFTADEVVFNWECGSPSRS